MHAGVTDPNVSAVDEAHYKDLPQIVSDADMRCLASMLTDDRGPQNNILNPTVEDRNYTKFTGEEVEKLIRGVEQYGRRWTKIKPKYFSNSTRTIQQLKDKWGHMLKTVKDPAKWRHMLDTVTDPRWTELYMRAKEVDDRYPKDRRSSRF